MRKDSPILIYAAMIGLLAIIALNLVTVSQVSADFEAKLGEATQKTAPPKIELAVISSSCAECSSVTALLQDIKALNVEIVKESSLQSSETEAKALISSLGIERLPAIVVTGEVSKLNLAGFKERKEALVFDSVQAPFEEASSGKIVGVVTAIILEDESCEVCNDLSNITASLKENGVLIGEERKVDYKIAEGQSLISQNGVETVPALLLSGDIEAYVEITESLKQIGKQTDSGFYLVESLVPNVEVNTGTIRGLVGVIYLADEECEDCYDVNIHKQVLVRFGIAIESEKTIDASSTDGKSMIAKYGIERVPTVVLQGDLPAYEQFETLWLDQVGTKESDGSDVFRELEQLGQDIKFRELP